MRDRNQKGRAHKALPRHHPSAAALRLLSSRGLSSGWARRIYHEPLRQKKPNFLTQNGPQKGAFPHIPPPVPILGVIPGQAIQENRLVGIQDQLPPIPGNSLSGISSAGGRQAARGSGVVNSASPGGMMTLPGSNNPRMVKPEMVVQACCGTNR